MQLALPDFDLIPTGQMRMIHGEKLAVQVIYEDQKNDFNSLFNRLSGKARLLKLMFCLFYVTSKHIIIPHMLTTGSNLLIHKVNIRYTRSYTVPCKLS